MNPPLVFPLRRGRLALLTLFGLVSVVVALWYTARIGLPSLDFTRNDLAAEALRAIGLLGAAFAGACTLVLGDLTVRPGPGLVIDDEGIVERTSGMAAGRVRWEEVLAVRVVPDGVGRHVVGLDLHDLEPHLDRLSGWRRWLVRTNTRSGWPPVAIHVVMIGQDPDALAALLVEERARRTGLPPLDAEPLAA